MCTHFNNDLTSFNFPGDKIYKYLLQNGRRTGVDINVLCEVLEVNVKEFNSTKIHFINIKKKKQKKVYSKNNVFLYNHCISLS